MGYIHGPFNQEFRSKSEFHNCHSDFILQTLQYSIAISSSNYPVCLAVCLDPVYQGFFRRDA